MMLVDLISPEDVKVGKGRGKGRGKRKDIKDISKGKGSKGKRNKGKEVLTKKSKKEKEDLIEKLELKGKKRIEIKKTIRIPVHYDVTKNKMNMLVRLTERITYGIRLIGELVSDVYADTFANSEQHKETAKAVLKLSDDNDIDSVLKLKTIEELVKDSDIEEKTGLNSNFIQQCINKVIWMFRQHRKSHKEWEGKIERTKERLDRARDDKEREKGEKWLGKLKKREPSKPFDKSDRDHKIPCRLDWRTGSVEQAKGKGKLSGLWIHISTLEKGKTIDIPLNPSVYHLNQLKDIVVDDFEIIKGGNSNKKKNKSKYYIHVSITKIVEEKSINSIGGVDQGLNKSIAAVLIPLDINAAKAAILDNNGIYPREEQLLDSAKVELLEKYDDIVSSLQKAKKWDKLRQLRGKRENVSTYHDWCLAKKVAEFTKGSYLAIGNSKFRQTQFRGNRMPTLRKRIGKWTYSQQRKFISLKRAEMGYLTKLWDEYGTSKECCECESKLVRRVYNDGFSYLLCHSCGMKKDADLSAANVIATRCRDDMLKAGMITVKNGVSL